MAPIIRLDDDPDSGLLATGFFYSVVDPYDYEREYDIRQTFGVGLMAAFQPGLVGEWLVTDPNNAIIFLQRNGRLKLIAGVYGVPGFRDGAGEQALFGKGGFQNSHYACGRLPDRSFLLTDPKNGKIRQLQEQSNGRWGVSTYMPFGSEAMAVDPFANIWSCDFYGATLTKILPNKSILQYQAPPRILQVAPLANGNLLLQTRNNAWDQTFRFYPATGQYELLFGSDHDTGFVDGAAIGEACFHTVGIMWANFDGSKVWVGGGDEIQLREFDEATGQTRSLFGDGSWRKATVRLTAPEPPSRDRPVWIDSPAGRQSNGLPWTSTMPWKPVGGYRWYKRAVLTDDGTVPPPPPEGIMEIISATISPTVESGKELIATVRVKNNKTTAIGVSLPPPSRIYNEGEAIVDSEDMRGKWRIGLDYEGRTGIDHPYRWGLDSPLAPGEERTLTVKVKLNTVGTKNYWFGTVEELIAWRQDRIATTQVTVQPAAEPEPGGNVQKTITAQVETRRILNGGQKDHFKIVVDGTSVSMPLSQRVLNLEFAPGPHVVEGQLANAADEFLEVPYRLEFTIEPEVPPPPPGEDAPVIVSLILS